MSRKTKTIYQRIISMEIKDNNSICAITEQLNGVYEPYYKRFEEIRQLEAGWAGEGSEPIDSVIVDNATKFFRLLVDNNIRLCPATNIAPCGFGTILFEFYKDYESDKDTNFISVEIGKTMIGWFTDWEHGINTESNGHKTDFTTIPERLLNELKQL